MSLILGSEVKSLYCGGEAKEAWLNGSKVWEKEAPYPKFIEIGGYEYGVVKIGNLLWTNENLKLNISGSKWYNNDQTTYESKKYGKLYSWYSLCSDSEVMLPALSSKLPDGWRLPTYNDLENLVDSVGGKDVVSKKLRANKDWDAETTGTDDYNFSLLPAGYSNKASSMKDFIGVGIGSCLISSTSKEYSGTLYCDAIEFWIDNFTYAWVFATPSKPSYYSVRLCRDV